MIFLTQYILWFVIIVAVIAAAVWVILTLLSQIFSADPGSSDETEKEELRKRIAALEKRLDRDDDREDKKKQ